jgi:hypothetical protein
MSEWSRQKSGQRRTGGGLRLKVKIHALCGVIEAHRPHMPTLDRIQELGVHHLRHSTRATLSTAKTRCREHSALAQAGSPCACPRSP